MKKLNTKKLAYVVNVDCKVVLVCTIDKASKDEAKKFIKLMCKELCCSIAELAEMAYVKLDSEDDDYDNVPEAKLLDTLAAELLNDRTLELSSFTVYFNN